MYDIIFFTDITETIPVYKSLGAYKLAYELRQLGYSCIVIDRLHTFTIDELKQILDLTIYDKTLFIGFSTTFLQNVNNIRLPGGPLQFTPLENDTFLPQGKIIETELVEYAKKLNKNIKILIGGTKAHPNLNNTNVDYAIIGFGESSIVNFADHLKNKVLLNFAFKNLWGTWIIDDKTASSYNFAESKMLWESSDVLNFSVLPFEVSRGCIFKCKFCSFPMNGKQNLDFIRSADNLVYELEKNYYEYGISTYTIIDDTFNDNKPKLLTLLKAINKLKFQPKFWAYNRLDLIAKDESLMDILYDIGLRGTQFGIETLNRRTGLIIGKGYDKKKQINTLQKLRSKYDNKISLHGTFIIGLPEEKESSIFETYNLLLNQEIPLHTWRFYPLGIPKNEKVAYNSELGINFKKFGYVETSVNIESSYINWKSNIMNNEIATNLANEFNEISMSSDHYYIPNILGWGLLNLGLKIEDITSIKYKDIDWNFLENTKNQFDQTHKKKLFEYLKNRIGG